MSVIEYRPAIPADIPAMMALMNAQYQRKKTGAYFQWQYFTSRDPTVSWCAFVGDELIGMFGLQKRRLFDGTFLGQAIDLLVSPQWRGKGVFPSLAERAASHFSDLAFFCVLPNANGKAAVESALGWKTLAKIDTMEVDVEQIPDRVPDLRDVLEIADRTRSNVPLLRFRYDDAFRQWRFDAHPEYHYRTVMGDASAFAFVKQFVGPIGSIAYGDIVDFSCDLQDPERLRDLFFAAAKALQADGVRTVTTWALPHTLLHHVLIAIGFRDMKQERYFCVNVLPQCVADYTDITRWHLVEADAELY